MKSMLAAAAVAVLTINSAHAGGWSSVHKYVKRTGNCSGGQEILASYYSIPGKTASGHAFDANGNTAAARSWALGTSLTVTNPHNGKVVTVVINDRGPYAHGRVIDLSKASARSIGVDGVAQVTLAKL